MKSYVRGIVARDGGHCKRGDHCNRSLSVAASPARAKLNRPKTQAVFRRGFPAQGDSGGRAGLRRQRAKFLALNQTSERRLLGYAVLANVASGKVSERGGRAEAVQAVNAGWTSPEGTLALLQAINRLKLDGYATQLRAHLSDARPEISSTAQAAAKNLKLDTTATAALIEKLKYEEVLAQVAKQKGDAKLGAEIFTRIVLSQRDKTHLIRSGAAVSAAISPRAVPAGVPQPGRRRDCDRRDACPTTVVPSVTFRASRAYHLA